MGMIAALAANEVVGTLKEETTALSATIYDLKGRPFEHYHKFFATKKVGKGTGLGLFICYGII